MAVLQLERSGVPILDRFAARISQRSSEDWAKWQLCRFAEIALEIMCYSLSCAVTPSETPESLFEEGEAATFGLVRERALKLAIASPAKMDVWGANLFSRVLQNDAAARRLEAVNIQRNNLAHGRASRSLSEIKELVVRSLQLDAWSRISDMDGELRLAYWIPWVVTSSAKSGQIGLFERWQKNAIRYLVPETGEVFKMPRGVRRIN
jgi:hypothetical protein